MKKKRGNTTWQHTGIAAIIETFIFQLLSLTNQAHIIDFWSIGLIRYFWRYISNIFISIHAYDTAACAVVHKVPEANDAFHVSEQLLSRFIIWAQKLCAMKMLPLMNCLSCCRIAFIVYRKARICCLGPCWSPTLNLFYSSIPQRSENAFSSFFHAISRELYQFASL